jgi:hypothetical protein
MVQVGSSSQFGHSTKSKSHSTGSQFNIVPQGFRLVATFFKPPVQLRPGSVPNVNVAAASINRDIIRRTFVLYIMFASSI